MITQHNFYGFMQTSAEIALLYRVSELAKRFGLRPSDADARLSWTKDGAGGDVYELRFDNRPDAPGTDKGDKFDKMKDALGCRQKSVVQVDALFQIEDIVEQAMTRAPRPRTIG